MQRPQERRRASERSRKPQRQGPGAGAIVALVLLVVGAVAVATWLQRENASEASASEAVGDGEPEPFSKYRDALEEERRRAREGLRDDEPTRTYAPAPDDLASDDVWVNALAIAADADEELDAANAAREAGDNAGYHEHGRAAMQGYDRALELTAVWEEELLEQYGERSPKVRDIVKTRSRWFDRLRVLHKTTGR